MDDSTICKGSPDLLREGAQWDRTIFKAGNEVVALVNGEQAYPRMLRAIRNAEAHVYLCAYQIDEDGIGSRFADALEAANSRGVEVLVLLDSWGDLKSHPSIRRRLIRSGIKVTAFHPPWMPHKYNRRYHRKLLLIDGVTGFTGGMNIRDRHLVDSYCGVPMRDTVFKIEGPVLEMLEAVFLADWRYCGGETVASPLGTETHVGAELVAILGAGIPFRRSELRSSIYKSIESSKSRVVSLSPFFFPDTGLMSAFARASQRGVQVELILPTGDFRFLSWCSNQSVEQLIKAGCTAYWSPPPYDHSKILLVDETVFIGTVNLDFRSLYINWEIALWCSGGSLVSAVRAIIEEQQQKGVRIRLENLHERPFLRIIRRILLQTVGRFF